MLGLRLVVHFLFLSVGALTGGMTRAAVSEGTRKVARGGLVPLSSVTSVSSALARSVTTGSKVLRFCGVKLVYGRAVAKVNACSVVYFQVFLESRWNGKACMVIVSTRTCTIEGK